jgi:hypothetical protein
MGLDDNTHPLPQVVLTTRLAIQLGKYPNNREEVCRMTDLFS